MAESQRLVALRAGGPGRSGVFRGWSGEASDFDETITVPFCLESRLSGIGATDFVAAVWYQRPLEIPPEWEGMRAAIETRDDRDNR